MCMTSRQNLHLYMMSRMNSLYSETKQVNYTLISRAQVFKVTGCSSSPRYMLTSQEHLIRHPLSSPGWLLLMLPLRFFFSLALHSCREGAQVLRGEKSSTASPLGQNPTARQAQCQLASRNTSVNLGVAIRSSRCFRKKHPLNVGLTLPRKLKPTTFSWLPSDTYNFLSAGNRKFILKYIHPVNFEDLRGINNRLCGGASHVRLAQDAIPDKSMFVFEYFMDHLLHLTQKDLSLGAKKRVLKDALRGLAELHDHDIVHTGRLQYFP